MEFYKNGLGEDMGKERFMTLQGMIKRTNGQWRSVKQANYLSKAWRSNTRTNENITEHFLDKGCALLEDGQYIIEVEGFVQYSSYGGRGNVPIEYWYLMDDYGIVKRYRLRFGRDGGFNWVKKVEVDWERDNSALTFVPQAPEPKAPEAISHHVGTVGKRQEFTVTIKRIVECETAFGMNDLYIMVDADGNVLKWFTSAYSPMEVGKTYTIKATVKEHSEYNGKAETMVNRVKVQG